MRFFYVYFLILDRSGASMFTNIMSGNFSKFLKQTFFVCATLFAVACSGSTNQDMAQTKQKSEQAKRTSGKQKRSAGTDTPARKQPNVPQKVYKVLAYVKETGRAPEGFQGGRKFGNYEKHLPLKDDTGKPMAYREWDVNPRKKGHNRGAERLITSENKHAWYTRDHYNSFIEIE